MRRLVSLLALVVIGSCAIACTPGAPVRANARLRPGALHGANVLLVTIDTLRADRVGAYGGGVLTPTLDGIARRGVRFANAHATAPLTLPAHASILTGLVPPRHGVRNNGATLDGRVPTLAEALHRAGYRTGAFVGAFVLDRRFGLGRGFDSYDDRMNTAGGPVDFAVPRRPADRVVDAAQAWILGLPTAAGPWFCWVHLFDAHAPYRPASGRASTPYDSGVAFADDQLGRLLAGLEAARQFDRTVIVVLADHGESLGDHGEATHGLFAYEATLRIPFLLAGPSIAPDVVSAGAGETDVVPTLLDLLGITGAAPVDGRSLVPALRGDAVIDPPLYFEALDAYLTRNWAPLTGVIGDGWKYIDLPEPELYDLSADPGETRNAAGREPQRVAALARRLDGWQALATRPSPPVALDPDAAMRLRALGYAAMQAPAAPRRFGVADDPKRLIDVHRRYERALTLTGDRRYDEAVDLLRSVIAARPDFVLAYTNLASVLIQSGRPRDAVALLEQAAAHGVRTRESQERLGAAYLAADDPAHAAATLGPLADRREASVDALNTLAVSFARTGRAEAARRLFARILEQSPASATTWQNLGLLEMNAHRPAEAARAFERAAAVDPAFAPAWVGLGAARAASDPNGAIDAWRRAVTLAPSDYDTLFNLIAVLEQQGRAAEARPYLERFVRDAPPARYASDIAKLRPLLSAPR